MSIKRCPECHYARDFYVTAQYQLECGYCGFAIGNIQSLWKAITHPYCIVTHNDTVLATELTHAQAEKRLHDYLNHGKNCYIGLRVHAEQTPS